MLKKRNHKEVIRKRKNRQENQKKKAEEQVFEELCKEYSEGKNSMPAPTLAEALTRHDISHDEHFGMMFRRLTDYFSDELLKRSNELRQTLDVPDKVVTFLIPLDFYVPLPEGYNSMSIRSKGGKVTEASCVTAISKILPMGTAFIKITYFVVSVCSNEAARSSKLCTFSGLIKLYEYAIMLANRVIVGFQSIPTRHNHYMHSLTVQSSPGTINMNVFDRLTKRILKRETITFHKNPISEIFNARPLEDEELTQFRGAHVNQTFTDDKVFQLVSKFNEAINMRCFGRNNEAVVLADNFVELSIGYLYCELCASEGEELEKAHEKYAKMKKMSDLWESLCELLNYKSVTKLRNDIGFNDWVKYCRNPRNDLTHRFLTNDLSGIESLNAIYHSGELVRKLCNVISGKVSDEALLQKLALLSSATYFSKNLGELEHDRKLGKHRREDE
jgi:hypothetical protein